MARASVDCRLCPATFNAETYEEVYGLLQEHMEDEHGIKNQRRRPAECGGPRMFELTCGFCREVNLIGSRYSIAAAKLDEHEKEFHPKGYNVLDLTAADQRLLAGMKISI